jgi:hypothetical protein
MNALELEGQLRHLLRHLRIEATVRVVELPGPAYDHHATITSLSKPILLPSDQVVFARFSPVFVCFWMFTVAGEKRNLLELQEQLRHLLRQLRNEATVRVVELPGPACDHYATITSLSKPILLPSDQVLLACVHEFFGVLCVLLSFYWSLKQRWLFARPP